MNLTVKLKDLRRIVDLVSTVTPTRTTLPSLNAVLLTYDDCVLTASASDLRSFARAHCDAVGEQSGGFGVKAGLLCDFLSRCTAEDVEITTDKTAEFICGEKRAVFAMIVPEEFKEHPSVEGPSASIDAVALLNALSFVSTAIADEKDGRAAWASVAFDFNGTLDMVALNGKLISICNIELITVHDPSTHLVPEFLVPILRSSLQDQEGETVVTFSDNMVEVRNGSWCISGPLLNLQYPDWRNRLTWLTQRDGLPLVFNRQELAEAVQACIPFGEAGFVRVWVSGDGEGHCTVEIAGADATLTKLKYKGEKFDFFVNARHMAPMLNSLSADEVTLEYKEEKGVGIVVHENNFTAAIMPLEK